MVQLSVRCVHKGSGVIQEGFATTYFIIYRLKILQQGWCTFRSTAKLYIQLVSPKQQLLTWKLEKKRLIIERSGEAFAKFNI